MPSMNRPNCLTLRQLDFELVGITDATEGYSVDRRDPVIHEVLYTCAGSGRVKIGGATLRAEAGTALILPAGHSYYYETSKPPWRIAWCHMLSTPSWSALENLSPQTRPGVCWREVLHALECLLAETLGRSEGNTRIAGLYGELLALYLKREIGNEETSRARVLHQRLDELWQTVSANLDHAWPVSDLAARMNMSVSSFHNAVVRHAGSSPGQMVQRLRMQRAEALLTSRDYPVKVIAGLLGYATPFAFSNAFKRHRGVSPSTFRSGSRPAPRAE
ncbi:MAG: AraC family transcriptional regulator [bacterium]|nr:AraC family transcriptional regulator [bacterium]